MAIANLAYDIAEDRIHLLSNIAYDIVENRVFFLRGLAYDSLAENYKGQPRDSRGRFGSGGGSGGTFDPEADTNEDGVADGARVGVPADQVPPPPKVARLPNLNTKERVAEEAFATAYESNPEGVASNFRELVSANTKPGEPKTFSTDEAKALTDVWSKPPPEERAINRSTLNTPLHQTANAVAKKAFIQELDTLKPGDEILVTAGGCGAGKGYALKNIPDAQKVKKKSKVVWDSAGDQNATENPWVQREAEARGLKVNYVYIHADPKVQWADPKRGILKRASNPKNGRMVDAKVFADSYTLGAKNHEAFHQNNKGNSSAKFLFIDNTKAPKKITRIPRSGLNLDKGELVKFATDTVKTSNVPDHIKSGALAGHRIWGDG